VPVVVLIRFATDASRLSYLSTVPVVVLNHSTARAAVPNRLP
jgi:hypothetical protein